MRDYSAATLCSWPMSRSRILTLFTAVLFSVFAAAQGERDPVSYVNPLIGTAGGGNTFPGAVLPFGMLSWSPENTRGDMTRAAAPGGYHYDCPGSAASASRTCRAPAAAAPRRHPVHAARRRRDDVAVRGRERTRSTRATSLTPTRRRPPGAVPGAARRRASTSS